MRRQFRKPLILGTSKRLLRYVKAVSKLAEIDEGKRFDMILAEAYPEQLRKPSEIKKVILCSG